MGRALTRDDLIDRLREQMAFLEHGSAAFDQGFEEIAKWLAVIIRVLVYDTNASHSVLGMLGEKPKLRFLNTADPIVPENLASTMGLIVVSGDFGTGTLSYEPKLGDWRTDAEPDEVILLGDAAEMNIPEPPPFQAEMAFDRWWTHPVTKDGDGSLFSRSDYVISIANKEGGAHVDPALREEWARLTRDNTLGWTATTGGTEVPMDTPALASVRQIAYEVNQTVRGQLSHLL